MGNEESQHTATAEQSSATSHSTHAETTQQPGADSKSQFEEHIKEQVQHAMSWLSGEAKALMTGHTATPAAGVANLKEIDNPLPTPQPTNPSRPRTAPNER